VFTPQEAVRALLTTQTLSLGGGKGVTSKLFGAHPYLANAPASQGMTITLEGDNLFESLMLNLITSHFLKMQNPSP